MDHQFINQFKENDTVTSVFQVTDKLFRSNKNGNFYIQLILSDRTGSIDARVWNAREELFSSFECNDFVLCEGIIQRFQGNLQFVVRRLYKADESEFSREDFTRATQIDVPAMLRRITELLHEIKTPCLYNLADCYLTDDDYMAKFCQSPAGIKLHHAYRGGLLEHTKTMMEIVSRIVPLYGDLLNGDLLMIATFLHDSGKICELACDDHFSYTDAGQLLGHSLMALEILDGKIREAETLAGEPFDPQMAMLLKHLIVSHHGLPVNGSTKLPMTLEAMTLHLIDSLDAKLAEFHKYIVEDPNSASTWTNYIPGLERKLYKG